MKKTLIVVIGIVMLCFGSIALAGEAQGPVMLTDTQMDNVVAAGPAWGLHYKDYSNFLGYAPGDHNRATYNLSVGDVFSARPTTTNPKRSNENSLQMNAFFYY